MRALRRTPAQTSTSCVPAISPTGTAATWEHPDVHRLLVSGSGVVVGLAAAMLVFDVVSGLDAVDVTDDVVQVVRSNEEQGREVVVLDLARATRWSDEGGPVRRVADRYLGEGNEELEPAFEELYTALPRDGYRPDPSRLDCRYWPVVRAGRPIEDVERLYRVCYDSQAPRARPRWATNLGVRVPG